MRDRCPHRGGPLSQGIVHGCRVTCPLHNMVIELENGAAVAPDEGVVARFPIKVEDGRIFLRLDPVTSATIATRKAPTEAHPS